MKKHIILEKAKSYTVPVSEPAPVGFTFDDKRGFWMSTTTGEALMLSPDPRKPLTKKEDRETGEDQKGE